MTAIDTRSGEIPTSDRLIWTFNMLMEFKATADETGGAFTAMDIHLTPAANPPLHIHRAEDESFFVLEGEIAFFLGEGDVEERLLGPGDFVFGPRNVPHRFEVRTPEARVFVIETPGGAEHFFRAMGEPALAPTLPVPAVPDLERVMSIASAHDVDIVGPPGP